MLIFTTNNRANGVSSSEQQHCENTAILLLDTPNFTSGMNTPSQISPIIAQRRLAYENDAFHYITTGAESEQPVGAPFYQWVGCRDHGEIACFSHSGSWQARGGPAYGGREQRKCVFHNIGPLMRDLTELLGMLSDLDMFLYPSPDFSTTF